MNLGPLSPPDRLAHVRVNPDRLAEEFARPEIGALLARGYRIAAVLPFEERGEPILVLVFEPVPSAGRSALTRADVLAVGRRLLGEWGVGCLVILALTALTLGVL